MKTVNIERFFNEIQHYGPPRLYAELFGTFEVELILDNIDDLGDGMVGIYKHSRSIKCHLSYAYDLISNGVFTKGVFIPDKKEYGNVRLTASK